MASRVQHGNRVEVATAEVRLIPDYKNAAPIVMLGLSVLKDGVKARPSLSAADSLRCAMDVLLDMVTGQTQKLLGELDRVYESDECVVCMESNAPLDVVFAPCGHRCVHNDCWKDADNKCPLDRTPITHLILSKK